MKMAELDDEVRALKACVNILNLLSADVISVVDNGKKDVDYSKLMFTFFDYARSTGATYVECREMVEWTSQLLLSFTDISVDVALLIFHELKEQMRTDDPPSSIAYNTLHMLYEKLNDKYLAERVESTITNFIQAFIDDNEEDIVYR